MTKTVILLTGATGLLGSHLTQQLLSQGYTLIACKRAHTKTNTLPNHPSLKWINIDILLQNRYPLEYKVDFVIHLAGLISYASKDKDALFEINEGLTKKIINWSINHKIKRFIYTSSIAALGKDSSNKIISEETNWLEKHFASNYGRSKRAAENSIKQASKRGLNYLILNPSIILGSAPLNKSSAQLFQYALDEKPFYTKGYINFIDVRDISNIIMLSIGDLPDNTSYIVNGGYTTYQQFFKLLAKRLNKRAPKVSVPTKLVVFGALLERLYCKVFRKDPFLSIETARMAGKKLIYSAEKLNTETNYQYYSLDQTFEYTIDSMKKNSYLKL